MTGSENYSLPPRIEWDFAPAMFKMDPDQTYLIDTYGADLSSIGEPLGLTGPNGKELLPGARSSVRVIVGNNEGCDYLDVMDLGAYPWYDSATKTGGNFALFRWSETDTGDLAIVGAETLEPGKILKLGRRDTVFAETPYPAAVQDEHVTIGMQSNGRLIIRNHDHKSRTEVWNMQFGRNVARPVLLGKEELATARRKNTVWHVGAASMAKALEPLKEAKTTSWKRRRKSE